MTNLISKLHPKKPLVLALIVILIISILVVPSLRTSSLRGGAADAAISNQSVLGDSTSSAALTSINPDFTQTQFVINIPALFKQNITAPNIVYSLTAGEGVNLSDGQNPTLTNTGVLSLQGQTGELSLLAGDGITLDGLKITNSGILSLVAGDGISVDGNQITNTGINSLEAGEGISIDGNKITNTRPNPNYSLSGWTDSGTTVNITTLTDSVLMNALTFGNASIKDGSLIAPSLDLGASLGDATHRFNNLWVGRINSNSSSAFAGQSIFSYEPMGSTATEASVIINPSSSVANGQLLGLALAGYQRAFFDAEGDLLLGYADQTSAPTTNNPLNIYGHSGTSVAHFDTSGNLSLGNTLTSSTGTLNVTNGLNISNNLAVNSNVLYVDAATGKVGIGTTTSLNQKLNVNGNTQGTNTYTQSLVNRTAQNTSLTFGTSSNTINFLTAGNSALYLNSTGNVGIGTTDPGSYKLNVNGTTNLQGATVIANTLDVTGNSTLNTLNTNGDATISGSFIANGSSNSIMGYLGLGTTTPTSQLDIASVVGTDALRLTSGGVKVLGMSIGTNSMAMDVNSADPTNRLTNSNFDTDLLAWTGSQTYSLNDEFSDIAPTTLATATPVTIQSGGITNPTPVLENQIAPDNTATSTITETDTTTGWAPAAATLSSITENRPGSSGTKSLKITQVSGSSNAGTLNGAMNTNAWYILNGWYRVDSGATGSLYMFGSTMTFTNTSWANAIRTARGSRWGIYFYSYTSGLSTYVDDLSIISLNTPSLFSTVPVSGTSTSTDYTVQTDTTLTAGTQAGLVMNLDSTSTPGNFIIAYHDGSTIRLEKAVAGTYTSLISTASTYIPGATIKVVKNGFNYSLYYNGVQKGTTQIITDAGIINNTNHGVFSTYASNSFSNFLVQTQVSNPTPTTGNEMLTNGNMETGNPPTGWTYYNNPNVSSVDDERSGGSGAKSLNLYANAMISSALQQYTTVAGQYYQLSAWGKIITGNEGRLLIQNALAPYQNILFSQHFTSSWSSLTITARALSTRTSFVTSYIYTTGGEMRTDDVTVKPLTLSSLFSTVNVSNANTVASTSATLTAGTQAGLVVNLDSVSNPQNFVLAYHDGTNMHLEKAVAGTYTALINTATTYVAGANITVRKNGTRYTLVYNGAQVGTDQTISDAGIINNTIHGLFSTYSGNTFTNFSIKTNLDGSLATDGVNTRSVTDIKGTLTVLGGNLNFSGSGIGYGTPGLWESSFTRTAGKVLSMSVNGSNLNANEGELGWDDNQTGTIRQNTFYFASPSGGNLSIYDNGTAIVVGRSVSNNTPYIFKIVLREAGAYYYIKGGTYTSWTLLYIGSSANAQTVYPGLSQYVGGVYSADNIQIPTSTWLPTPLAYDTFTATGSATTETTGPDGQTTPTLSWTGGTIAGGKMSIAPTSISEIAPDNSATSTLTEADTTAGYTGTNSTLTSVTDNRAGSAGTKALNIMASSANGYANFIYSLSTASPWFISDFWYKLDSGNTGAVYFRDIAQGNGWVTLSATAWTENLTAGRMRGTNGNYISFISTNNGQSISTDDFSFNFLNLSSLFATISASTKDVIADVNITSATQNPAGIATNLNSGLTAGLVAYISKNTAGSTNIFLDKFTTASSWTNLFTSSTVTYVPGATLRVITYHSDANTLKVRVYYNNALVGTEQTVTDAGIINNTIHGLFSTYSGNTFDNFTLWPRGTGGEFAQLTPEDLTVTRDTNIKFAGSTSSAKIIAGATDNDFTQTVNVGDTSTYTLTAYAYTNGSAVTGSDLQLYYSSAPITTTYTPLGGEGWYRLQGTVTGIASNQPVGVRVKAGRTVYLDNVTLSNGVATPTTMYVFNSGTGKANLNVQGLIDGTLGGIATFTKAGTVSDTDFTSTTNGMLAVDTLNHRLYFRENDAWSYIARTGGFQIPAEEVRDMEEGDLLLPYVESRLSDGALHGLYTNFSDIMKGGQITIVKDSDRIDILFDKPFIRTPNINVTLVTSLTDNILLPEGHAYSIENLTKDGFTLVLDAPAGRNYTYSWSAQLPE